MDVTLPQLGHLTGIVGGIWPSSLIVIECIVRRQASLASIQALAGTGDGNDVYHRPGPALVVSLCQGDTRCAQARF